MPRLSAFTFTLPDEQEATFFAPAHSQALELAIIWSRARGLSGPPSDHEKDRVSWDPPEVGSMPTKMPARAGPKSRSLFPR
jgi:hypothetical protein